ncbi:hypothetical protein MTsPCn5_16230 [Croceitalea sp. MTPC5]|uniref:tetratricopeptide repeat protein n=1 Tax=Croceitalea sp. MTPC5 TaxID=3056565 RepID=UPI002B370266|nr:hypothetical protein MTsPCn5_16230 [Croceitalea sp. MTPC5]
MKQVNVVVLLGFLLTKVGAQSLDFAMADSLYRIGDYTKAINAYAKIGDEKANLQIARAYAAQNKNEKAIAQYQGLVENYPENILAQFELGKLYDKTKQYTLSISLFKNLTETTAQNPEFFYFLGKALQATLDYDKGNEALQKAIDLDSTHLRSIYLLGKYYVSIEEPSNALKTIELGLKTAPNNVALLNLKALTKFETGVYEEAASLFERLLELGETKPFIYKKLGYSLVNRWRYKEAKEAYKQLGRVLDYQADAYKGLAQVYFQEQKLDSSETYYLRSIEERRYSFDEEYRDLGRIARLKGELKKSLDYYTKAWEENKANPFNYWQVCILADEYYKDPKVKLRYYQKLLTDFKEVMPFMKERAQKRITELKEEIHFGKD